MKRLWACLAVLLVATLIAGCAQMSAEDIAKKMEEKYKAIKDMKGEMVTTVYVQGKKIVRVTKFAMKKPDKFWSDSENYTIVSNGTVMWIYDKKKNIVTETKLPKTNRPKFDYGELIKDLMSKNNVKLLGSEKVYGRDCYVIEATPKNRTFYVKQKLWIDKEYWYPLKIESDCGLFKTTIEYKDMKFNTGIPDSFFNFKPPEGVKVVEKKVMLPKKLTMEEAQKRVNFTIITPRYTAGYKFEYAYVFKYDGNEEVILHYSKDGQKLTVVESRGYHHTYLPNATKVNINGTTVEISNMFGINIARFCKGNISITISAKLPKDELISIVESMI